MTWANSHPSKLHSKKMAGSKFLPNKWNRMILLQCQLTHTFCNLEPLPNNMWYLTKTSCPFHALQPDDHFSPTNIILLLISNHLRITIHRSFSPSLVLGDIHKSLLLSIALRVDSSDAWGRPFDRYAPLQSQWCQRGLNAHCHEDSKMESVWHD